MSLDTDTKEGADRVLALPKCISLLHFPVASERWLAMLAMSCLLFLALHLGDKHGQAKQTAFQHVQWRI